MLKRSIRANCPTTGIVSVDRAVVVTGGAVRARTGAFAAAIRAGRSALLDIVIPFTPLPPADLPDMADSTTRTPCPNA
jgi:hypothetical protein